MRTLVVDKDKSGQYCLKFDYGRERFSEPHQLPHGNDYLLRKLVSEYKKEGIRVKNGNLDKKVFDYIAGN